MIPAVAVAAILASGADARGVSGRFKSRFQAARDRYTNSGGNTGNNGYEVTTDRQVSAVKCTATAGAKNFKLSIDAHVKAVTEAWKYACKPEHYPKDPWGYSIVEAIRYASVDYDAGVAYAKAIAGAETECNSRGNAWGCAAAYAYSAAWADAVVTAHASAWSEAVLACDCDGVTQEAGATSDAYAAEIRHLNAEVAAYAESHICVDGDDHKYDFDAQTCVQDIYATALAKSVSGALVKGKCVVKPSFKSEKAYSEFLAKADTFAKAQIDTFQLEGCVGYIDLYNPYH